MNERTRRLLGKLYLSGIVLSAALGVVGTAVLPIMLVHDEHTRKSAVSCHNKTEQGIHQKMFGEPMPDFEKMSSIPGPVMDRFIQVQNSDELKLRTKEDCGVERYGDSAYYVTTGWWSSPDLWPAKGVSPYRDLVIIPLLWIPLAALYFAKKYFVWLLK
jgi:hypothetical protein